jgi:hypothetical protein
MDRVESTEVLVRNVSELIVKAWRSYEQRVNQLPNKSHLALSLILAENKLWDASYTEFDLPLVDRIRASDHLVVYTLDRESGNTVVETLKGMIPDWSYVPTIECLDIRRLLQTKAQEVRLSEIDLTLLPFRDVCSLLWLELSNSDKMDRDDVQLAKSCLYHLGLTRLSLFPTVEYLQKEMLRVAKRSLEYEAELWMSYRFTRTTLSALKADWGASSPGDAHDWDLSCHYIPDYSEIREELADALRSEAAPDRGWDSLCENLVCTFKGQAGDVWINPESGGICEDDGDGENLLVPKDSFAYPFLMEGGLKHLLFEIFQILKIGGELPTCSFTSDALDWYLDYAYTNQDLDSQSLFDETKYAYIYDIVVGHEPPLPPEPAQEVVFTTSSDRSDIVNAAQTAGFDVYCMDGEYALTISGGGYSLLDHHYVPLFQAVDPTHNKVVFVQALEAAIQLYREPA